MRSRIAALVAVSLLLVAASAHADTYKIDPVHSAVIFANQHMNAGILYGRFNDVNGTFSLDGDDLKIDATVKAESLDTNNQKRDSHLKSGDFFNAAQFPTITFKSKKSSAGKEPNTVDVVGDLTLHGVTKEITVTIRKTGIGGMPGKEVRGGIETSFTLKRTDYGMDKMVGPSGDEVKLIVALEGVKE
jgi:polyisoprenoid-binding protein YceI